MIEITLSFILRQSPNKIRQIEKTLDLSKTKKLLFIFIATPLEFNVQVKDHRIGDKSFIEIAEAPSFILFCF